MKHLSRISEKLKEADFFLQKMTESQRNVEELNYYFSAFSSAARSVTFVMQYIGSTIEGFDAWYAEIQSQQRSDKIAKYLLEARNQGQKTGAQPIAYGEVVKLPSGEEKLFHYFSYVGSSPPAEIPNMDVLETCHYQMKNLTRIVGEFFDRFENNIWNASHEKQNTLKNLGDIKHKIHNGTTPDSLWQQILEFIGSDAFSPPRPSAAVEELRRKYQ